MSRSPGSAKVSPVVTLCAKAQFEAKRTQFRSKENRNFLLHNIFYASQLAVIPLKDTQ